MHSRLMVWDNPNLTGLKQEEESKGPHVCCAVFISRLPGCSFCGCTVESPKTVIKLNVLGQSSEILVELTWGVIQLGDCIR